MSKNMQGFGMMIQKLKESPKRIVFTEGTDERILEAASRLLASNFLTPILKLYRLLQKNMDIISEAHRSLILRTMTEWTR